MRFNLVNGGQRAGVLVITLVISICVGIALVGYLSMVSAQQKFVQRSLTWNNCMPLCEAGIEEAFAHLNHTGSNSAVNGWVLDQGAYRKHRDWPDGFYRVAITTAMPPVITVEGNLRAPLSTNFITRRLEVKTKKDSGFPGSIVAKEYIDLKGGTTVNSFNSTNSLYSTSGQYDPSKPSDRVAVLTPSTTPGAVNLGNNEIFGKVGTGLGGSINLGTHGNIGSYAWNMNLANDGMIEPGYYIDDIDVLIPDGALPNPFGPIFAPGSGTVNGTNYAYILGNGDYSLNSIKLTKDEAILVTGKARLHVTGDTSLSGQSYIQIEPGASLEFYSSGTASLGGGGILNLTGIAQNFSFIGLPTCTFVDYTGGSTFIGSIYAPHADVKWAGGNETMGAVVGKSFTFSGNAAFHFDEALLLPSALSHFLPISWQEL